MVLKPSDQKQMKQEYSELSEKLFKQVRLLSKLHKCLSDTDQQQEKPKLQLLQQCIARKISDIPTAEEIRVILQWDIDSPRSEDLSDTDSNEENNVTEPTTDTETVQKGEDTKTVQETDEATERVQEADETTECALYNEQCNVDENTSEDSSHRRDGSPESLDEECNTETINNGNDLIKLKAKADMVKELFGSESESSESDWTPELSLCNVRKRKRTLPQSKSHKHKRRKKKKRDYNDEETEKRWCISTWKNTSDQSDEEDCGLKLTLRSQRPKNMKRKQKNKITNKENCETLHDDSDDSVVIIRDDYSCPASEKSQKCSKGNDLLVTDSTSKPKRNFCETGDTLTRAISQMECDKLQYGYSLVPLLTRCDALIGKRVSTCESYLRLCDAPLKRALITMRDGQPPSKKYCQSETLDRKHPKNYENTFCNGSVQKIPAKQTCLQVCQSKAKNISDAFLTSTENAVKSRMPKRNTTEYRTRLHIFQSSKLKKTSHVSVSSERLKRRALSLRKPANRNSIECENSRGRSNGELCKPHVSRQKSIGSSDINNKTCKQKDALPLTALNASEEHLIGKEPTYQCPVQPKVQKQPIIMTSIPKSNLPNRPMSSGNSQFKMGIHRSSLHCKKLLDSVERNSDVKSSDIVNMNDVDQHAALSCQDRGHSSELQNDLGTEKLVSDVSCQDIVNSTDITIARINDSSSDVTSTEFNVGIPVHGSEIPFLSSERCETPCTVMNPTADVAELSPSLQEKCHEKTLAPPTLDQQVSPLVQEEQTPQQICEPPDISQETINDTGKLIVHIILCVHNHSFCKQKRDILREKKKKLGNTCCTGELETMISREVKLSEVQTNLEELERRLFKAKASIFKDISNLKIRIGKWTDNKQWSNEAQEKMIRATIISCQNDRNCKMEGISVCEDKLKKFLEVASSRSSIDSIASTIAFSESNVF